MNQPQPYMDGGHGQQQAPAPNMPQYSSYGQPQALQPATHSYAPQGYPQYSYSSMPPMSAGHPVTSSMGGPMLTPNSLPLPTMASGGPPSAGGGQQFQQAFDTTGQIAPPGMKPRVTATLWEDEGSLCFQVEANGVCVARREDNHMINGTKLLNVAGMTRGRRDGILKSEKTRHVVKIGPMHLKGVWIPFDRALDFANKEKITELLYPLFVHNIGALLYHPTNQARQSIGTAAHMAAVGGRRPDSSQEYMRTPQGGQAPALTHHHSMNATVGANVPQPPHSIAPHPGSNRPVMDRAQTFPTPPTSASGMNMNMGTSGNSYEYGAAGAGMHSATTPPGNAQGMQYQQTSQPTYNSQYYSAPSSYSQQYAQQPAMHRYGQVQQSPGVVKTEMGPPARAGAENEHGESKPHDGYNGHQDADEGEYIHRPVHTDPAHVSPDMNSSPHPNGHGSSTPRTTSTYTGYQQTTPRQSQLPSSNLNYVMSNDARAGAQNGADAGYQSAYPSAPPYPAVNGTMQSNKRGREVDDQDDPYGRPISAGGDASLKRQRTDPSVGMAPRPISQPQSAKVGGMRR